MTAVDRKLAKLFRAARWADSGGKPVCAKCYDADDVREGFASHESRGELERYYCACCKYHFTDATGTPLAYTSRPLALWAFVALGGSWGALGLRGHANKWRRDDLRGMARRLAGSQIIGAWTRGLTRAGITLATLAAALRRRQISLSGPPPGRAA